MGEREYLTVHLPFPTEFALRKGRQPAPAVAAICDHLFLGAVVKERRHRVVRSEQHIGSPWRVPPPRHGMLALPLILLRIGCGDGTRRK
jgi:hypothetical protein